MCVVTVDNSLKEMAEYMEASREEVWEKALPNKQVTFLVYREGDQLNFFRVVDRGDGTLTPVSESIRLASLSFTVKSHKVNGTWWKYYP